MILLQTSATSSLVCCHCICPTRSSRWLTATPSIALATPGPPPDAQMQAPPTDLPPALAPTCKCCRTRDIYGATTSAATSSARKQPTTPSTNMASNQSYRTSFQQQASSTVFFSCHQTGTSHPSQPSPLPIWHWMKTQPWLEHRPSLLSLHCVWCRPYHWPFSWTSSTLCYWQHQCCTTSQERREETVQSNGQWWCCHTQHCTKAFAAHLCCNHASNLPRQHKLGQTVPPPLD